ncbi:hypothetical protein ACFU9X_35915 [Streptomyces atratus]|uniref:hypothetical protein n=1 Tax=Streptomyces atratus TaxID=1893 RepID=UPI0036C376FE
MEAIRDVLERWNAEIADALVRVDATLADASARGQAVIPHIVWDLTPLEQPWQAVEHQMHQYGEQIEAAWNRISDELAEFEGLPEGLMWREGWRRDWATSEIEIRYTRAHRLAVAAAADVMRHRALQADVR